MKTFIILIRKFFIKPRLGIIVLNTITILLTINSCKKVEYPSIDQPAYIRVFNNLWANSDIENKDLPQPFFTMLINPTLDADGVPIAAEEVGDFLDTRDLWARPYPDAGNTSLFQKEYPGSLKVQVGPILNGYDLSSWAKTISGKRRFMIISRPKSTTSFFALNNNQKKNVVIDTIINLQANEIYTIHILQEDIKKSKLNLYVREETFQKQALSDSLVYINFYNLSAKGFIEAEDFLLSSSDYYSSQKKRMRDEMIPYLTLFKVRKHPNNPGIAGFIRIPLGERIIRSQEPIVKPYRSFPLFPIPGESRIYTGEMLQTIDFFSAENDYSKIIEFDIAERYGHYTSLNFGVKYFQTSGIWKPYTYLGDLRTGLIASVHSGKNNPQSFATVNSLEYVNGRFYLMTVQRRFEPPQY